MSKPNFFIIGAPKCGTSALSEYLRHHPNVFMSMPKEPHYFNTDFSNRFTNSLDEYESLFRNVGSEKHAVGEASIFYLASRTAVDNIMAYNKYAVFIVMLRNPIDAAYAWHSQVLYNFGECERSFSRAWDLQHDREQGRCLPRGCHEPKVFMYGPLFKYGEQLERVYSRVPRDRVKVIFFDDLARSAVASYKEVLEFLGVPYVDIGALGRVNANRSYRSWAIERLLRVAGAAKRGMGVRRALGIRSRVAAWNTRVAPRVPLTPSMRTQLADYYRADIARLSRLVDRDLRHWTEDT